MAKSQNVARKKEIESVEDELDYSLNDVALRG